MARKHSRSRFAPSTERAIYKEEQLGGRHIDRTDLMDAIRGGEDSYLEFKVRFSNPEKIAAGICALANSGGGTIVFGVTDGLRLEGVSHPELIEQDVLAVCRDDIVPPVWVRIDKVAFDSGMRIVVVEIDGRRAPHRTTDGRFYVRVGATKREATGDEVADLYRGRTGARAFEDVPLPSADADLDVDEGVLWSFARELRGAQGGASGFPVAAQLSDMRLAVRYGDAPAPTVAGLLLFGRTDSLASIMPQAAIDVRRVTGTGKSEAIVEEALVGGNLGRQFDRALAFVERYADLLDGQAPRRERAPVAARPTFARAAVVEALANALVHRDYAQQGVTRLALHDDRFEIANPAPDARLSRRTLELGVRETTNPRVKGIFCSPAYGAYAGRLGVPAMLRAVADFTRNREPARIAVTQDSFRVEIPAS